MKFPIFASVIVFCIWLAYEIKKSNKKGEKAEKEFWKREAEADKVRKQPLDNLNYIHIPDSVLAPFCDENGEFLNVDPDTDKVLGDAITSLSHLKESKIVNLTNISNTDLKLSYGAANLPELTLFDQNFTLLSRTLQDMAEYFYSKNDTNNAKIMLEFAISSGSDSISSYKLLAKIYSEENDFTKINYLISSASLLNSLTKGPILKALHEISPSDNTVEESILDILD